jgi:hypothetical protein
VQELPQQLQQQARILQRQASSSCAAKPQRQTLATSLR